RRYWDLDPRVTADATDEEHAERFGELFRAAVECRVRDADSVGVLLSGGIDSSSIAGVAHAVRGARGLPPPHAFSATFPGRDCDESPYIDAVVRRWGLPATRVEAVLSSRADLEAYAARYLDVPMTPGTTGDVLRRRAAAMGVGTILTGLGGDD